MKQILSIFVVTITLVFPFKVLAYDSLELIQQIDSLKDVTNTFKVSLENLSSEVNTLDSINKQYLIVKKTDDIIIREYSTINNLFGIGFGVLLALFGLIFPLILYFMQIKPTNELIHKLENDFENSFKEHMKKHRERLIDEAIDNYLNNNVALLSNSYVTLNNYKNEGFSDKQVIKILKALKLKENESKRANLTTLLNFKENEFVEDYYKDLIQSNPKDSTCIYGALYFASFNKTKYIDKVADIVINGYSLIGMIASLEDTNKDFSVLLLNNKKLIDEYEEERIYNYCRAVNSGFEKFVEKHGKQVAESTLIYKKYQEIIEKKGNQQ